MFKRLNKSIMFIAIIFVLIMLISFSFAMDNDTSVLNEESDEIELMSVSSLETDTLKASNDYYFNASVENDGDGSLNNPYKYLTNERIKANSNIYLADGEYKLDSTKIINQVNIYGSNTNKTTIIYLGTGFNVMGSLSVNNVTLKDLSIINNGKLKVKNTVFDGGVASVMDSYGNNFGGAIYTPSDYPGATVEIENTVFNGTYAEYGGAIYMGQGILNITNSLFYDIYSYSFGGAIACEFNVKIRMSNVKILKCKSLNDAGGAIYIKESSLTADNLNITDCESTFGGAITALSSDVSLNYFSANNNIAEYNGGAIYQMYGTLNSNYGRFYNNSASNGGAIFIDNVTSVFLLRNNFINNKANHTAGAIYSLLSNPSRPFMAFNSFYTNTAKYNNDCYELSAVNLTIGDGNYTMYNNHVSPVNNIPAYYNLASRDLSTSVKDQQSSGTCWSFSSLAALESCILKASGEHIDLSEEHMKNIITLYSDYGWILDNDDGGYDSMPMAYLTSWLGPVLESNDPFDDHSALSPLLKSIMHVQNIIFLKRNSYTDNNEIKEAILKYGAVSTSIYMDSYYLNYDTNAYWSWTGLPCNHAVAIIGWDDNYDKSNFKFGGSIEGNGAWIVKNSWGTNWGDKGYFYVSYYDTKFAQPGVDNVAYTFILNDTIKYDKNYQYDIGGKTDYFRNGDENVWYKNIFTSTEHEYLTAVSTYFEKITNWSLTVKVNDIVKITKTGKYNPGYYTIDLGEFLELNKNDVFEIIFNIDTGLNVAGVPVSEKVSLTKELYKPETSYISYNGINWIDLYNLTGSYGLSTYSSQVACIKAFTITNELNATVFIDTYYENDKLVKITANSVDQYGNKITKGNITFNINGLNYTQMITGGEATLNNPVLNQSISNITITLVSTGYKKSENKTTVTAPKTKISLNMDIKTISNNATVTLKTNNYTGKLNITINDNNYTVVFNDNEAVLDLTLLENNKYDVKVIPEELSLYEFDPLTDSFTIDFRKTDIISDNMITVENSNELFNITLIDEKGEKVIGKEIIFTIGSLNYTNTTNSDGTAFIPIDLTNGEYEIKIRYDGDNDYTSVQTANTIKVKINLTINIDVDVKSNNANITVTASKPVNETFTVNINTNKTTVKLNNGKTLINLYNLTNGEYAVNISMDNDDYMVDDADTVFTVDVKSTHIVSDNLVMLDDETALFNITLFDENNSPISGKEIIFSLTDESVITDVDGRASIPLTLANGEYLINIHFKGDDDYFASESTNNISVKTAFSINLNAERVLNNVTVNVELSKELNVTLTVDVNGNESEILVKNGKAVIDLSSLANCDYTVKVDLNDSKYVAETAFINFTVNVKNTRITSNDIEAFENEEILFNITLTDENNNLLTGKNITVQLNNNTYATGITNEKGIISIPIKLNSGEYIIESIFCGDNNYIKTITSNNIKISIQNITDINNTGINDTGDNHTDIGGNNTEINGTVGNNTDDGAVDNNTDIIGDNTEINGTADNNTDIIGDNTEINGTADNNTDIDGNDTEVNGTGDNNNTDIGGNNTDINLTSDVNISIEIIKNRNNVLINIGLSKELNDTLKATVNDKTYIVDIIDGKGVLELNDLSNKDYDVFVEYGDKYNSIKFTIDIKQSKIIVDDLSIFNQNSIKYNITLLDENNNPLKGKTVRFNIENNEYSDITDDNGQITLNISLTNGNHKITVNFDGDDNYLKSDATGNIDIKTNVTIDLNIEQKSNNAVININLSENINATLSVTVNGKTQNIKVNSNSTNLTLFKLDAGSYNVQVGIVENDLYAAEKTVKQFNINVKGTVIHSDDLITYYCGNDEFTVTLTDIDGYFLEDKLIIFKIGDNTHFRKTDSKGQASININLTDDVYDLTVLFKGDDNYHSSYANNKITVKSTIIPEDNLTKTLNSNYGFKLLNTNGESLANTKITFTFNNIEYNAVPDVNGNVNIKISEKPGSYTLILENPVTGENLIKTVNVVERITENKDMTIYAFSGTGYKVLIMDDNGNKVKAGEIVTFKINGNTVNAKTDSNGYASLKISLKAKTYTVTAEYKGFKVSNKIKVKPVLTAKNISKKKAKSYKFQAKLVNAKGKALKGKKITFKIKGKKYTVKTNKKGVATVNIKLSLKVGSYKITSTYGKSKITNTLKIKK